MARRALRAFLDELMASGDVTAVAAVVGDARAIQCEGGSGSKRRDGRGRVTTSSLFDLASLTKPVVATLAQVLDAEGVLPLRRSVARALAQIGVPSVKQDSADGGVMGAAMVPELEDKTLGALLRHRAGFGPWAPLFARCATPAHALSLLVSDPSLHGASAPTYSDLGFILWGRVAEQVLGKSLPVLLRERVVRPLGIPGLGGPPGDAPAAVECRLGNGRERELARAQGLEIRARRAPSVGTVQDGNARFLGVSGHAGLFGSARSLWRLAAEWTAPVRVLDPAAVATALAGPGDYVLGWRRRPLEASGRSGLWYGHLGFTGGGAWFCPETEEIRVLLTHRSSASIELSDWRKRFLEVRM